MNLQEFTLLSRRYESASPIGEHPCPRYDDLIAPSIQCRPLSSSPSHHHHLHHPHPHPHPHPHVPHQHHVARRYEDSGLDDHFDDEFDYTK